MFIQFIKNDNLFNRYVLCIVNLFYLLKFNVNLIVRFLQC
jgi:hypothetical protein